MLVWMFDVDISGGGDERMLFKGPSYLAHSLTGPHSGLPEPKQLQGAMWWAPIAVLSSWHAIELVVLLVWCPS